MHFIPYIFGVIVILVGIKTIFTQEASVSIQLWGNTSDDTPHQGDRGYSTSEQTGFIAVLIGFGEIAIGVGLLFKGSAFFN